MVVVLAATLLPVWAQEGSDEETECEEDPDCEVMTVTARRPDSNTRSAASHGSGDDCPACAADGHGEIGDGGASRSPREEEEEEEEEELSCQGIHANIDEVYSQCMISADIAWGNCKSDAAKGGPLGAILEALLDGCGDAKAADEQRCSDQRESFNNNTRPECRRQF